MSWLDKINAVGPEDLKAKGELLQSEMDEMSSSIQKVVNSVDPDDYVVLAVVLLLTARGLMSRMDGKDILFITHMIESANCKVVTLPKEFRPRSEAE